MSWSPDLFIGELHPWPDSVHVVRGKTDEVRRYMPERKDAQEVLTRRIDELCAENERLRQENQSIGIAAYELGHKSITEQYAKLQDENARLRSCLSDDAENARMIMGENANLRELVRDMWPHVRHRSRMCAECELPCDESDECLLYEPMRDRMSELGIEVDE